MCQGKTHSFLMKVLLISLLSLIYDFPSVSPGETPLGFVVLFSEEMFLGKKVSSDSTQSRTDIFMTNMSSCLKQSTITLFVGICTASCELSCCIIIPLLLMGWACWNELPETVWEEKNAIRTNWSRISGKSAELWSGRKLANWAGRNRQHGLLKQIHQQICHEEAEAYRVPVPTNSYYLPQAKISSSHAHLWKGLQGFLWLLQSYLCITMEFT